jgi:hypothetical protein
MLVSAPGGAWPSAGTTSDGPPFCDPPGPQPTETATRTTAKPSAPKRRPTLQRRRFPEALMAAVE